MSPNEKHEMSKKRCPSKETNMGSKNPEKLPVGKRRTVYDRLYSNKGRKPGSTAPENNRADVIRTRSKRSLMEINPPVYDRLYSKGTTSSLSKRYTSKKPETPPTRPTRMCSVNNSAPSVYNRLYSKGTVSSRSKRNSHSTEPIKEQVETVQTSSSRRPMGPRN